MSKVTIICIAWFLCLFKAEAFIDVTLQMQIGNPSGVTEPESRFKEVDGSCDELAQQQAILFDELLKLVGLGNFGGLN